MFVFVTSALGAPESLTSRQPAQPAPPVPAADRSLGQISHRYPPVTDQAAVRIAPRSPQGRAAAARAAAAQQGTRPPAQAGSSRRGAGGAYVVESGDSLWAIAQRHDVSVEGLAAANRLALTAVLQPGQRLAIPALGTAAARPPVRPATTTTAHVVRPGETLWGIAQRYGARVEDIMAMNDLGHSDWIKPGQRIVVSLPRHRQVAAQARQSAPVTASVQALRASAGFLWPSRGIITSRFGWRYRRHHDGIDIAAPSGTPIYAARAGVVEFAGWRGGYGRVVYLNHGDGIVTVYGHASVLKVRTGQRVEKGQLIARVGRSGNATGPHLHFEVRVNGRAVNPLAYLTRFNAVAAAPPRTSSGGEEAGRDGFLRGR
jgi:murein DD-endopeptidase MepM/ murein hydrolase activator NlpD